MKKASDSAAVDHPHFPSELEPSTEIERMWIDEAQRRYDAYLVGELESLEGDDVMNRARSRVAVQCL